MNERKGKEGSSVGYCQARGMRCNTRVLTDMGRVAEVLKGNFTLGHSLGIN